MLDAILEIVAAIIAIGILVALGNRFGYGTLPKALLKGLGAMLLVWFLVWFIFDQFTIFEFVFNCSETHIPWVGRGKVCDFLNIPLVIGLLAGLVVVVGTFMEANEERRG